LQVNNEGKWKEGKGKRDIEREREESERGKELR
jgi:hypothetical protein